MKALIFALTLAFSLSSWAAKVGEKAPNFTLKNQNGKEVSLSDYKGKLVVLEWHNRGCPYVKKHYNSGNMQRLQKEYKGKDVVWLSIISSAPGEQGHMTPKEIKAYMKKHDANPSHVLIDAEGKVGKSYNAKVTPHMYVINPKGNLVYMGAIDDKPTTDTADIKGATNYVKLALNNTMNDKPVETKVTKAYGCSVKYK